MTCRRRPGRCCSGSLRGPGGNGRCLGDLATAEEGVAAKRTLRLNARALRPPLAAWRRYVWLEVEGGAAGEAGRARLGDLVKELLKAQLVSLPAREGLFWPTPELPYPTLGWRGSLIEKGFMFALGLC